MFSVLITLTCCLTTLTSVHGGTGSDVRSLPAVGRSVSIQELFQKPLTTDALHSVYISDRSGFKDLLSQPCRNHTEYYESKLMTDEWAMKMKDSSANFPEGVFYGSLVHMGNYDECINVRDVASESGVFHGQHCLASITVNMSAAATRGMLVAYLAVRPLKMGLCVPSSCSTGDTALIATDTYKSILSLSPILMIEVDELECHTADGPSYKAGDWVAITILIFFGLLVLASTCYDLLMKDTGSRRDLLLAFSVYTNGKKLLTTSTSGDTLHCLHGIRFISMVWVVYGHCYMNSTSIAPAVNLVPFVNSFVPDWKGLAVTNGNLSVDTFFLLSGLLVAYVFFRQVPKTNSFNIPLYYLHRYIRLTPAYAVCIMLVATLWRYTGSGPVWDSIAQERQSVCEDKWWANLLYVSNYVKPLDQCIAQGWYLAVDMQLHWLSPIVLIPLWKRPRIGWILMAALMVAGIVTNFVISYVNDFTGSYIATMKTEHAHDYTINMYYPVYTRFMPYLIGIGLGYLLVDIKIKKRNIPLPKIVTLLLWLVAGGLMLLTLFIVHVFQQPDYEFEPVGSSFYNALARPGWSLGLAIIIFLCATGHGGFPNTLLSWEWFQVLGRLSYSVYLVHISVQVTQYGSLRQSIYIDDMTMIPRFCGDLLISLLIAVPLSLVFESPFIILEKELLGGKKHSNRKPTAATPSIMEGTKKEES